MAIPRGDNAKILNEVVQFVLSSAGKKTRHNSQTNELESKQYR